MSGSDTSLRNPAAQIASQANVSAQRMEGVWAIRQRFDGQAGPERAMELAAMPDGALQLVQRQVTGEDIRIRLEPRGPGRWAPAGAQTSLPEVELWVMWMDFDDRTAAIGTPGGQFGWIMDKATSGGADRIVAAREIMDWFGYDVSRLQVVLR